MRVSDNLAPNTSIDASTPPDFEAIQEAWEVTLAEPERRSAQISTTCKDLYGKAPDSIVPSAEGVVLFEGFSRDVQGRRIGAAALACLGSKTGEIDFELLENVV